MWSKETLMRLIENNIPQVMDKIFELNDYIALHPELGSEEFESSKKIVNLLQNEGLDVIYPFDGMDTAFKASINKGKKNKVALLVEYDALPDIGHACGHCASGMASIMAGLSLYLSKDEIDAQIDLIGTPDEEMNGMKCLMADHHVFDEYDFAAMVHMGGTNTLEVDFIALTGLTFQFYGQAAHAAQAPEKGRNALNAVRLLFDSVDMMRQHVTSEARIHGYIKNGGNASNVVPDYTEAEFLARAPHTDEVKDIVDWMKDCGRAAALATRTEVKIQPLGEPFFDLHVSSEEKTILEECFKEVGLELSYEKFVGSSDIGNVDYICPAFHPVVSIGQELNVHTKEFADAMTNEQTHTGIVNGAKVLLNYMAILQN
ncbi:amidohydrolase [Anaerovorax sp. IOR16]|uniref:amidohydrolase n=1 Tax=Anaerovorax sp. IOR16 TaxID=2773458 RepID=UPI0019CFBD9F|nr:amidohydrolase [Anaerovorax sp. IOR16]